jgi:serine/threonine protein kinase
MDLTVQNVYGLLLRSNLLTMEEARTMYARWQEEAKENANNLVRFAAWMVSNKYVTEYQASLLARGHADDFFLNEYRILDRLGKGRMAGVYKARHRLGQSVAIKVLPPSRARDSLYLARFQREARMSVRLKHPNIVRTFQVGKARDLHYIVMEHLEGLTVEDLLDVRPQLPPTEAVRIVYQALGGLQHIHEQGLVHRDLKPANLMLVPVPRDGCTLDCTVKILDIGLGRALFDEGTETPDAGITTEGVLLGTPDYMAPEQARDPRLTDIRADIYSLGCVLYHLLAGQPPFPDTNIISQMIRHASETPRPLCQFNPSIPDGLQQIVNWMLAKEASGRYPTPERAAQALEVFLAAGGPLSSPDLDPNMRSYLTWLEGENRKEIAFEPVHLAATTPMASIPDAKPLSKKPPTMQVSTLAAQVASEKPRQKPPETKPIPPGDPPSSKRGEKKSQKKRPPTPVSQEEISAVDVELVTPPSPPTGLTRRDFILFFAGVGSGLLAYGIGRGLAALVSRSRTQTSE